MNLIAKCGAESNSKGLYFQSQEALEQHERDCRWCNGEHERQLEAAGINPDIYDMLDPDMPDGAFWALYHELGCGW